jgi:hypothetical protein
MVTNDTMNDLNSAMSEMQAITNAKSVLRQMAAKVGR